MKRTHEESTPETRVYASTALGPDARTVFARLYLAWKKRGQTKIDFRAFVSEAGYDLPLRTLDNWIADVHSGGSVGSSEKHSGRPLILVDDEIRLLTGFVLDMNDKHIEVHLRTAQEFVRERIGKDMSLESVDTYLHRQGFTSQVAQTKTKGYKLAASELCNIALNWLKNTPLSVEPSKLASIDFVFTGHRTDRRTSFALCGGPQPKSAGGVSTYTNCIVTCVWADAKNHTPAMLFTLNPQFRRNRHATARRSRQVDDLDRCLEFYCIKADRIVHIGKQKGEKGCYASESPDLLRRFFEHYGVPDGCTILSDNSKSFFEKGEDILRKLEFQRHCCYPAPVHQYLSPNDNRLHGAAKKEWRESGVNFSDDVFASSYLLHLLDSHTKHVGKWFKKNLQLEAQEPILSGVENLIKGTVLTTSVYYQDCLREYRIFALKAARDRSPSG